MITTLYQLRFLSCLIFFGITRSATYAGQFGASGHETAHGRFNRQRSEQTQLLLRNNYYLRPYLEWVVSFIGARSYFKTWNWRTIKSVHELLKFILHVHLMQIRKYNMITHNMAVILQIYAYCGCECDAFFLYIESTLIPSANLSGLKVLEYQLCRLHILMIFSMESIGRNMN